MDCAICAECEDSPLSVTGNIISILTFVLALVAAVLYRGSLLRGAGFEIYELKDHVRMQEEILIAKLQRFGTDQFSLNWTYALQSEMNDTLTKMSLGPRAIGGPRITAAIIFAIKYLMVRSSKLRKIIPSALNGGF
ncbi:hypothetical protein F4677DRAFT_407832 [Hypoxylon crocopeplum]|nr:hypothetical protein F4677DRAFT_407832 [Hypoxylon crocopeplum]